MLPPLPNDKRRHEWVQKALKALPAGIRLLDAGAGERRYKPFCSHITYVSQDFGKYDGKGDGKGLQMGTWDTGGLDIVSDITAIPEPDASFDAILCSEVFEHLPDPLLALKEFSRLLKPGGTLILTAPFCSLTHFAPFHFYSGFSRYFYEHHLPLLGFKPLSIESNGTYFDFLMQEMFRVPIIVKRNGKGLWRAAGAILWGFVFLLGAPLLLLLKQCNVDSQDILCFGYHVIATRNLS